MADRPILFSGPMVRALLDGRKTQTRRILKPQPIGFDWFDLKCKPRIRVGDRLWVKENAAVRHQSWHHVDGDAHQVCYRADEDEHGRWLGLASCGNGIRRGKAPSVFPRKSHNLDGSLRWQPSIHMPRWASRITLIVTDVRVERLRDISEEDAIAEGVERDCGDGCCWRNPADGALQSYHGPVNAYAALWESINGAGSWDANPRVAAYTFTVIKQNIDQIARAA